MRPAKALTEREREFFEYYCVLGSFRRAADAMTIEDEAERVYYIHHLPKRAAWRHAWQRHLDRQREAERQTEAGLAAKLKRTREQRLALEDQDLEGMVNGKPLRGPHRLESRAQRIRLLCEIADGDLEEIKRNKAGEEYSKPVSMMTRVKAAELLAKITGDIDLAPQLHLHEGDTDIKQQFNYIDNGRAEGAREALASGDEREVIEAEAEEANHEAG